MTLVRLRALGAEMNTDLRHNESARQQRMARRTAWILGGIAVAMFLLSIVQQLVLVHQGRG
jgi:hypothetical protein